MSNTRNVKIEPKIIPNDAAYDEITFTSNNPGIASVNENGVILPNKPGKAKITITANMTGVKKAPKCVIDVIVTKRVTGLSTPKSAVVISAGKTEKLSINITPEDATNKKVKWTSSAPKVASVDEKGTVKALKAGTCNILCSTTDGSNLTKSFSIHVIQPVTAVKTTLDTNTYYTATVNEELHIGNAFYVEPADATNKEVEWVIYKDNKKLEKVYMYFYYSLDPKTNILKIHHPGFFRIEAVSKEDSKKKASIQLAVRPEDNNTLSFETCWYENGSNNTLNVSFDIFNEKYGITVTAVELYVYTTDVWGNDLNRGLKYHNTTSKRIDPGKKVRSETFSLPNRNYISKVYVGIHKIKFSDGTSLTIDDIEYVNYSF